jgi:hypothetical protein
MDQEGNTSHQPNGLSIVQLLEQANALGSYLLRKWLVLLLTAICFGIIGWVIGSRKKTLYQAELSFALDEKAPDNAQSAFSVFSQQLGLEPVDGGKAFSNTRNIEALLKSRLMIEKTLLSVHHSGKDSLLFFDYFLDSLELRDKWAPGTETGKLYPKDYAEDSVRARKTEQALMKSMYLEVSRSFLSIQQKLKGSSILDISLSTPHEGFSKHFLEKLVSEVSGYYIESKTRRSKTNLKIIENRNDSIRRAYQQAIGLRASFADADINLVREIPVTPAEKMQTDVQILKQAYVELSRNLETAKTAVMNETPIIEIIDPPKMPLDRKSPTPLKNFIIFSFLGLFLAAAWMTVRWVFSLIKGNRYSAEEEVPDYS